MKGLLLAFLLAYIFAAGYWIAKRTGSFAGKNPDAFPGLRRHFVAPPPPGPGILEDDEACVTCYNRDITQKELLCHEKCDP